MPLLSDWIDSYPTAIVDSWLRCKKIVKSNATGRRCRMSSISLPLICLFGRFWTRISGSHPS